VPTSFKSRPTTDFSKENLFNVLNNIFDFEEACALDLFAGTGSISFELLSRGCKDVVSVEKEKSHSMFIRKVSEQLKTEDIQVITGDAFRYLDSASANSFDFIFADPPYALKELPEIPKIIIEKNLLRQDGVFVMEHSGEFDFSLLPMFKQKRVYGSVNFSLFYDF
jgi:16S rRNA (guanine(966)-N(2))-methyltransferase RsmD